MRLPCVKPAQTGRKTPTALEPALKQLGKVRLDTIGQQKLWADRSQIDTAALSRMNEALDRLNVHLKKLNDTLPTNREGVQPASSSSGDGVQSAFSSSGDGVQSTSSSSQNQHLLASLNPNPTGQNNTQIPLSQTFSSQSVNDSEETPPPNPPIPHPTFPQAMYGLMREFAPGFLLAGADQIEDNTVTILDINAEFIEAFMLGLNHEMARELLWRNYPTDRRGTYFQNFWSHDTIDLKKIHQWSPDAPLGETLQEGWINQANGSGGAQLALIIRAELLRRFPNTIIYAVKAATKTILSSNLDDKKYPIHRGELTNDAIFLLFNLDEAVARGKQGDATQPGWFFIFQQQPTETRFGLDVTASKKEGESPSWEDLSWEDIKTNPSGYISLSKTENESELLRQIDELNGLKWNFNGAHTAEIFLQQPYKIGIHASNLLPAVQS